MVPTGFGFRFSPTDEELIQILNHKVSGNTAMGHLDFIVEKNIYELEPQHLQWTESVALNKNERYYYCKRESDSREVTGRGWWKSTSHLKTISDDHGRLLGYKRPLTFHRFKDNQRNRKNGVIKTDWIMHEYKLHSIHTDWRLCKIKYKGKGRLKEDMENIINNNIVMSSEPGLLPMQLEFAFEEKQPWQLPPLPVINDYENYLWSNSSNIGIEDYENYLWSNSSNMGIFGIEQPFSSENLSSSSMPKLTPVVYDQIGLHDNQLQPFPSYD